MREKSSVKGILKLFIGLFSEIIFDHFLKVYLDYVYINYYAN